MAKFYPKAYKKNGKNYCRCKVCGKIWQVSDGFQTPKNGYACIKCDTGKKIVDGINNGYFVDAGIVFLNEAMV